MGELSDGRAESAGATGEGVLVRVEGRVQGVGFRAFVRARAQALGVSGWTCNLPDGAVAVAMSGPSDAVGALRSALASGPTGASVTRVREMGPVPVAAGEPFQVVRRPPTGAG